MMGGGKLIRLGRVLKKSREKGKANGVYHCSNLWQEALFPFQKLLSINLAPYQASAAGL